MTSTARPRRTHAERNALADERLTNALAELVAEQGFERTTAAQIGERAGYSRAAVRDRYGSKEALLRVLHERCEGLLIGDGADVATDGLGTMMAAIDRLIAFGSERPIWLRALFVVSFESVGASKGFLPVVNRWVSALELQGADWLTAGQDDGSVNPELDPVEEAQCAVDEAIAAAFRWTLAPDRLDYPAYLEAWATLLRLRLATPA